MVQLIYVQKIKLHTENLNLYFIINVKLFFLRGASCISMDTLLFLDLSNLLLSPPFFQLPILALHPFSAICMHPLSSQRLGVNMPFIS